MVVFSPHPDDDSICMGGTIQKLVRQGHTVHCAEMVSGNYGVFDHDALKYMDFLSELSLIYPALKGKELLTQAEEAVSKKENALMIRQVKSIIRRIEARQSMQTLGVLKENVHHLDLPFYEVNSAKKGEVTEKDKEIIRDLILEIRPTLIYAAGDLSDPHGTHRVCLKALLLVLEELKVKEPDWYNSC